MSNRVTTTLCIGLIVFGLGVTICLGMEDFIPQLTDVRDLTDTSDNKQNLQLMQAIQQYASKINPRNYPEYDTVEEERKKRSVTAKQEAAKKSKREVSDSIADLTDYPSGKRGVSLQKNPLEMGFKNRPGFRSWGGKRAKFVTWGGKRLPPGVRRIRKSKFNNWGGKRSEAGDYDDLERFDEDKRDTFRSWGGKRFLIVPPTLRTVYDSHSKFSNWGGKRYVGDDYRSGKRDLEYTIPYEQDDEDNDVAGKRGQFQSWGGKRFDFVGDRSSDDVGDNCMLRQNINSVLSAAQNDRRIGKKNLGSKPLEDDGDISKFGFSAWRGKR